VWHQVCGCRVVSFGILQPRCPRRLLPPFHSHAFLLATLVIISRTVDGYCAETGWLTLLTTMRGPRVLESVKAGKRLPEARFTQLKIAAQRQQSVLGAFSKANGSTQRPAAGPSGS
jgi:hypothetical protein